MSYAENIHVVGVGTSAGGVQAFQKFLEALPRKSGMAFIAVLHLDPAHQNTIIKGLTRYAQLKVQQADNGMSVERDCVYVVPAGAYLAIRDGAFRISEPRERHGAHLPFDFLLSSLAEELGENAIGVVLSGTGNDGSRGAKAVKEGLGLVIAQDPDEATFGEMPRNAIMTGSVDLTLPIARIPDALFKYHRRKILAREGNVSVSQDTETDCLPMIVDLIRDRHFHDFTMYKPDTVLRRVKRRMAISGIAGDDMTRYLDALQNDPEELNLLAKDLLINVTRFFRDPELFDLLEEKVVPQLVRNHTSDRPLRIWVAGCSTGEEAYSLVMIFLEQIEAAQRNIELKVFASDTDADAVAVGRKGRYPDSIETEISPARLGRFFNKEKRGYSVLPELQAKITFTVHDVLTDPPFFRLDMISCRNLLIYLNPEAQAKVISLFDFGLHKGGILFLGASESAGDIDGRFETISPSAPIYRHIGPGQQGEPGVTSGGNAARIPARQGRNRQYEHPSILYDLCQRLLIERHAPATVLINRKHECLYALGPIDRYLRAVRGPPTRDVFLMARDDVKTRLISAVEEATRQNTRVEVSGGHTSHDGEPLAFSVVAEPVTTEAEELLLVRFVDRPEPRLQEAPHATPQEASRLVELEQELASTRTRLSDAIHKLEEQTQAQKVISEEVLSINEAYQSTKEKLETSKEELQSLDEELTALNNQLRETLEEKRTTDDDLQNVLNSTDIAMLFLDTGFNIRFFTPATRSLFNLRPSDIGRPITDLHPLAPDNDLLADARSVLQTETPLEKEIGTPNGVWYIRRILPYRTEDDRVEGIVITFDDITERRHITDAMVAARREAEKANAAKSRFLAIASHDLRQPLQTLQLLQALLAKSGKGKELQNLVTRFGETLASMSNMLNALLDLNQIETGTVHVETNDFPIGDLLGRLKAEFTYHAESRGLALRVVPCSLWVHGDPALLEQMIRNLLWNALKFTPHGRVLLGCRRRGEMLSIEVWDTGIGIPAEELDLIFEEYRQLDKSGRDVRRGLGLGLSIVQRLAHLLGYRTDVRSNPGRGSGFMIEAALAAEENAHQTGLPESDETEATDDIQQRKGVVMVVEDDTDIRELLGVALEKDGLRTITAAEGKEALQRLAGQVEAIPDVIVADFNLQPDMSGLEFLRMARERLRRQVPGLILTGDISAGTLRDIEREDCRYLSKPVELSKLLRAIRDLLPMAPSAPLSRTASPEDDTVSSFSGLVYIVDDDREIRQAFRELLEKDGRTVETFSSAEAFLEVYRPGQPACLLIDAGLPGMSGLELLNRLDNTNQHLAIVMITGHGDVSTAVQAMKAGASDFLEKPVGADELTAIVEDAVSRSRDAVKDSASQENAAQLIAMLTPRQREIMELVLAGNPSKNIAADLGISQRTVEKHRSEIMRKTGSKSLPALARLALAAAQARADDGSLFSPPPPDA